MKDIKTIDLVKILPFDDEFKHQLLSGWESMSPDDKYRTERALWDLYDAIYTLKLDEKIELALADTERQDILDQDFYKKLRDEVEAEMQNTSEEEITTVDLSHTRQELQKILEKTSANSS